MQRTDATGVAAIARGFAARGCETGYVVKTVYGSGNAYIQVETAVVDEDDEPPSGGGWTWIASVGSASLYQRSVSTMFVLHPPLHHAMAGQ